MVLFTCLTSYQLLIGYVIPEFDSFVNVLLHLLDLFNSLIFNNHLFTQIQYQLYVSRKNWHTVLFFQIFLSNINVVYMIKEIIPIK